MAASIVVDTGPIVALLDEDDQHHDWAVTQLARLQPPLLTCEAVLTEASFLIARVGQNASSVTALVDRGVLSVVPLFTKESASNTRLVRRYANVPMSLADACLVRIVELTPKATLFTFDSDFEIYRQKGRGVIPLLAPPTIR